MKVPQLYVVTRGRAIAKAQLQTVTRSSGKRYLYLQWKDGRRPRRVYLGIPA